MKRFLAVVMVLALVVACAPMAYASEEVAIYIDGVKLECEQPPVVKDGVVLIRLFDLKQNNPHYDPSGNIYIPLGDNRMVKMSIGSNSAQYQDEFQNIYNFELEAVPMYVEWDVYIPICDAMKCIGASYSFDAKAGILQIDTNANIQYFDPDDKVIDIFFDGEEVKCDPGSLMRDDRIIIPIRAVSEVMKYTVDWNEDTQTASISNDKIRLEVRVGSNYITRFGTNGSTVDTKELNVPAQMIKDRVFVPIRAVSECFGARVTWSPYNQAVYIQSSTHDETHDSTNSSVSLQRNNSIGGLMTFYDGWIYYSYGDVDESEGKGIWKIRSDGSGKTQLTNDNGAYLNIVDGWLYYEALYSESEFAGQLYRIRLDGTNKQSLNDTEAKNIVIVDGWIYYSDFSGLYKVRLDGCDVQKLNDDYIDSMNIFVQDGYIYYKAFVKKADGKSAAGIVRIKTDGTDYTVLTDNVDSLSEIVGHGSFTIADGWIYYKAYEGGWIEINDDSIIQRPKPAGTWRMRLDGSEKTLLTDVSYASSINVVNGKLYGMTNLESDVVIDGSLLVSNNLEELSTTQNIKISDNLSYIYGPYEIDGKVYFIELSAYDSGVYILNEQEGVLTRVFD